MSGELAAALLASQKAMPAIHKDSKATVVTKKGDKFSYTYLSLQTLLETVLPVLNEAGLALSQVPTFSENGAQALRTTLLHGASGETLVSDTPLILVGETTPQTWGGAVTYARRYAISALLGIAADEDDDAQAASRPQKSATKKQTAPPVELPESPEIAALIIEVAALRKVDAATVTQALVEQFGKPLAELGELEVTMATSRLKGWRDKAMAAA